MLNRREFLAASGGTSLAMFGAGFESAAQGAAVTRRSIRGMAAGDPDLAALRRAVAAMKSLPPSDPRNWLRFADIHRNFCPHGNWYFLPWHRAYLVAFENICRQLSGKPDFALPYWDWSAERQLPIAFSAGDRNSNPLNHARPGWTRGMALRDDMVGLQVQSRIMNSPDFEAFGSTRPRGQSDADPQWQRRLGSKTELEFNPHDGIHQAIGGDMAESETAPRDPIFYLHHANIDRLWTEWNRRGNANSPEPMWREFAFSRNFLNPDGTWWDVTVGNLGSTPALGYRYDDDDGPFAADVALPMGDAMTEKLRIYRQVGAQTAACASAGLYEIALPSGGAIEIAVAENNRAASHERPLAISVPLRRRLGDIIGASAMAYRPAAMRDRRYVWAILCDLDLPQDSATRVRVYCNCHDLSARTGVSDPSYATSLSFFGGRHMNHGSHGTGGATVCVDLTPTLARMANPRSLGSDMLTVQLVPSRVGSDSGATAIRPRRVEIVII